MKANIEEVKNIIDSRENILIDVQDDDLEQISDLYRLYEFSDKITLLEHINYPGIDNYVKTGVLTQDEMCKVLEVTDEHAPK